MHNRIVPNPPESGGYKNRILILRIGAAVAVLVYGLLLFRPNEMFLGRPFVEDSFYSLSVARSISAGTGISVDGVHPTNGVQPLICFVNAPLFSLSKDDPYLGVRFVMGMQILLYVVAAYAFGKLLSAMIRQQRFKQLMFWAGANVVLWNYSIACNTLNGLETALSLALVLFSAAYYYRHFVLDSTHRWRATVVLGALLGLSILARIDSVVLVAAICAYEVFNLMRRYKVGQPLRNRAAQIILVGCVAVAVSSPWWLYNYQVFGSFMPISGKSQLLMADERFNQNTVAVVHVVSDALSLFGHTPFTKEFRIWVLSGVGLLLLSFAIVFAVPALKSAYMRARERFGLIVDMRATYPLWLFAAGLAVYYVFVFGAPHFMHRYLAIIRLLVLCAILSIVFVMYVYSGRASLVHKLIRFAWIPALVSVPLFVLVNSQTNPPGGYEAVVRWIDGNTNASQKIGMFQSGTTGFMFPERVINLDGKVNAQSLHALAEQRMPQYTDSLSLDYIIDWKPFLERYIFSSVEVKNHYQYISTVEGFMIWKRIKL